MKIRTYSELIRHGTIIERFYYLKLDGKIGISTFGYDRYLNQKFYKSKEWLDIRDFIIVRDNGCDFGLPGYEIASNPIIHHMNPIRPENLYGKDSSIIDPNQLILVSSRSHRAIHFGKEDLIPQIPIIRKHGDTLLWRKEISNDGQHIIDNKDTIRTRNRTR